MQDWAPVGLCVCDGLGGLMFHGMSDFKDGGGGDVDGEPVEGLGAQVGEGVQCRGGGEHEGPGFGGVPDAGGGVGC